jgi:hypothetical protein
MKTIKKFTGPIAVTIVLLIILLSTNPQKLPAILLIVPFVLLFIIIYRISSIFLKYYFTVLSGKKNNKRSFFSGIIALVPVTILILQSIGQLTTRDVITLVILAGVGGFYVTKFSFLQD